MSQQASATPRRRGPLSGPPRTKGRTPGNGILRHDKNEEVMYQLTTEESDLLVRYLNGEDDAFLATEGPDKVFRIARDLARKMFTDVRAVSRERDRLRERIGRLEARRKAETEAQVERGEFQNLMIPAADLGWAILEAYRAIGRRPSRGRIILTMYECYCSWLGSKREVLTVDSPVTTKYGPQFWSAWNKVDPAAAAPRGVVEKVYAADSGLRNFIANVVAKYADTPTQDLTAAYACGSAYLKATERGGGRANTPIDPRDIYRERHR